MNKVQINFNILHVDYLQRFCIMQLTGGKLLFIKKDMEEIKLKENIIKKGMPHTDSFNHFYF